MHQVGVMVRIVRGPFRLVRPKKKVLSIVRTPSCNPFRQLIRQAEGEALKNGENIKTKNSCSYEDKIIDARGTSEGCEEMKKNTKQLLPQYY